MMCVCRIVQEIIILQPADLLLKKKSNTFEAFKAFKAHVKLQFGTNIVCLHNDKGSKYISHLWDTFFAEHGIWRKHTVEGMLQQGGVAECHNCMLEEHVVAILNSTHLPTHFWGKALYTYGCLLNMTPLSAIPPDTTPYKMAHKHKPNYSTLCIFGCCTWVHVCCKKQRSLEPHAKPCMFLGVPDNFKGRKLWDPSAQGSHCCGSTRNTQPNTTLRCTDEHVRVVVSNGNEVVRGTQVAGKV
jgi:hypothetical protein